MLHAFERNKSNLYNRYLGYRDGESRRVTEEDEITSIVFGPLDFMEAGPISRFWREMFRRAGYANVFPLEVPVRCVVGFWPRKPVGELNGIRVEPDAHLIFSWGDGRKLGILIEIKWRAPLSGEDQLYRQWVEYLTENDRTYWWHVFIAPDVSAGIAARLADGGDAWRVGGDERLILISWSQIRDVFSEFYHDDALSRWAKLSDRFLEKIGVRSFHGFSHIDVFLPESWAHETFYRGLNDGFKGFKPASEALLQSYCRFLSFFQESRNG